MSEEISKGNGVEEEAVPQKPAPRKRKRRASEKKTSPKRKKTTAKRKKKIADAVYNVDIHPETQAMLLPELHYYRLVVAEQQVKIQERDLEIAKARVRDFQTQANTQLQGLQSRVKETSNLLNAAKASYFEEVRLVEADTKLALKDWMIDDDRVLRPVEQKPPEEESGA